MMKVYKKLHLIMWTNYKHHCNSVVGQYFKDSSDVISVSMATGLQKGPLNFSFCKLPKKLTVFIVVLESTLNSLTPLKI